MRTVRRLLQRLTVSDRGTAAIEGAIVMPFLILLFVGIADFGRVLWHYQIIVDGVRDATRYLSRVPHVDTNCTLASLPGTAEADAKALATTGRRTGGTPKLSYWTTAEVTVEVSGPFNLGGTLRRDSCLIRVCAVDAGACGGLLTVDMPVLRYSISIRSIQDEARHYGD